MTGLRLSVVMPAYNEAETLERSVTEVVEGLGRSGDALLAGPGGDRGFEVIVVENGSTDGTLALARELAVRHPDVRCEHLERPDYGAALRAGLLAARGELVVNFDADYYDLDFVAAALRLADGAEAPAVVVGSKRSAGSLDTRTPLRRLVTGVFTFVLRRAFGLKVSDTHGMKLLRREVVVPFARQCRFGRDLFDTELILRVERAGARVTEIPVAVSETRPARTSILRRVPRTIVGLVRLRVALWREAR